MFAVIKTGGKQYRVAANDVLKIEKVEGNVGDIIEIGHVLAHGEGDSVTIGAPFVSGASVAAEVVEQGKARTVIAFKKRRRQNSRRKIGHRQLLTTVRISEILVGGAKPSKKAEGKPAAKPEAKAEAAPAAAGAADDITLIGGVGPTLKKKLQAAGITTLKEIAALSADEIARLDADLKLGGRIEREEWVEQAKELLAGKPPRAKVDQAAAAADGE
ncbi:MAG: 50S ribosomal protein L21 [Rhizobiaceae bacterium]|nr:50S ribosomal protein L21 [Rhizobiaceae bacterium]